MLASKRLLIWAAIVMAALVTMTLTIFGVRPEFLPSRETHSDSRAYEASSRDVSLMEGLRRADISLPPCAEDKVRYAFVDNGFGYYHDVYLRIEAPQACLQKFVDGNAMVGWLQSPKIGPAGDEEIPRIRESWLDNDVVKSLGWQVGPEQRFQRFAVSKQTQYTVTLLLQHIAENEDLVAYVHAARGG